MSLSNNRKAIVVHSPHSGKAAQLQQAIDHLRENRVQVADVLSIATLDKLDTQGSQWKEHGINLAVAAGGDGLIGGVTTHIVEGGPALGILPLGTSNDIARSLRIPLDLRQAAEAIANGQIASVDVGVAQPAQQTPYSTSEQKSKHVKIAPKQHGYFAHALTVGLNTDFARLATNVVTRKHYGRLTYPYATFEVLRHHEALDMEFHFDGLAVRTENNQTISRDGVPFKCRALQATIVNAPIFGGRWQLTIPEATLDDGLLDILVIEDIDLKSLHTTLTNFFSQAEQRLEASQGGQQRKPDTHPAELTSLPGIHHVQARSVTIRTPAGSQEVTLDGEIRGQTPVDVRMADAKLQVVVPGS